MKLRNFFPISGKTKNTTIPRILWILLLLHIKFALQEDTITFTIVHTGNLQAQIEEKKPGLGGIARIVSFVKEENKSKTPMLLFDTGDSFIGTLWFWALGADALIPFFKLLAPTAICFGDHEMHNKAEGLKKFITQVGAPLLCCNCDFTGEPLLRSLIIPYTEITVESQKVGVLGYITQEASHLSYYFKNIAIHPEIPSLKKYVQELQQKDISIIIVVGHGYLAEDENIIREVDGIDVLLGGHKPFFYYTGKVPNTFKKVKKDGDYPLMVENKNGTKIPVLRCYQKGLTVGKLSVKFSKDGELLESSGNSVIMDNTIKPDDEALNIIKSLEPQLDKYKRKELGRTRVDLNGDCREKECNMGNLMTDSWIDYAASIYSKEFWTDSSLAVVNGGAFQRGMSLNESNTAITLADIISISQHQDLLNVLEMNGSTFRRAVEFSVSDDKKDSPRFFQYSGVHIKLNFEKKGAERIEEIKVRCADCDVPRYEELVDDKMYKVLMSDFLSNGGDGYVMFRDDVKIKDRHSILTNEALVRYIEYYKVIQPNENERIIIVKPKPGPGKRRANNARGLCILDKILLLTIARATSCF